MSRDTRGVGGEGKRQHQQLFVLTLVHVGDSIMLSVGGYSPLSPALPLCWLGSSDEKYSRTTSRIPSGI